MEGIIAMHLASLIILSGMPLSGVPMISSRTLAELSIRFSMSDSSLSAAQLGKAKMTKLQSPRRIVVIRTVTCFIKAPLMHGGNRVAYTLALTQLGWNRVHAVTYRESSFRNRGH